MPWQRFLLSEQSLVSNKIVSHFVAYSITYEKQHKLTTMCNELPNYWKEYIFNNDSIS